jgi:hypothetical protein
MPINCIAKAKVVSFPPVANGLSFASKVLWGRSVAQSGAQFCAYTVKKKLYSLTHQGGCTMRTNLLNWCNLVSTSKNVVFYAFLVVRIY